jgi:hypothetical protein
MCFQQCFQSIACVPSQENLNNKGFKNKEKDHKNKEMNNLGPWLTLKFKPPTPFRIHYMVPFCISPNSCQLSLITI